MSTITEDPKISADPRPVVTLERAKGLAGSLTPVWAILLAFRNASREGP